MLSDEDCGFLSGVHDQFGSMSSGDFLVKKIQFYMQLPSLAPAEVDVIRSLVERYYLRKQLKISPLKRNLVQEKSPKKKKVVKRKTNSAILSPNKRRKSLRFHQDDPAFNIESSSDQNSNTDDSYMIDTEGYKSGEEVDNLTGDSNAQGMRVLSKEAPCDDMSDSVPALVVEENNNSVAESLNDPGNLNGESSCSLATPSTKDNNFRERKGSPFRKTCKTPIPEVKSLDKAEKTPDAKGTPIRRIMMRKCGFEPTTPSFKPGEIGEEKARRVSLGVHLWAFETKSDGFLRRTLLTDNHFVEIFTFCKSGILGNISLSELKSIWRNPLKSAGFYTGHFLTGFQDLQGVHGLNVCHFQHCYGDLYDGWKEDLAKFTPPKPEAVVIDSQYSKAAKNLFQSVLTRTPCPKEGCDKIFTSSGGLQNHLRDVHECFELPLQKCPICPTVTKFLEQHKLNIHPDIFKKKCEVCDRFIEGNFNVHKAKCSKKCPYSPCPHKSSAKCRVLRHMKKCPFKSRFLKNRNKSDKTALQDLDNNEIDHERKMKYVQEADEVKGIQNTVDDGDVEILQVGNSLMSGCGADSEESVHDLKSRLEGEQKTVTMEENDHRKLCNETDKADSEEYVHDLKFTLEGGRRETIPMEENGQVKLGDESDKPTLKHSSSRNETDLETPFKEGCSLLEPRKRFPFDSSDGLELYDSEYEEGDDVEYTSKRRAIKDEEEVKLRDIDSKEETCIKGEAEMIKAFDDYLKVRYPRYGSGEWLKSDLPSTIQIQQRIFQHHILAAFVSVHGPDFDCRWIADGHTEKDITVFGENRTLSKKEPAYFTSQIFDEANKKFENKETNVQRSQFMGAVVMTMDFIEALFNNKMSLSGIGTLRDVQSYHLATKNHYKSIWTKCNEERNESVANNRLIKEYKAPNSDAKKLIKYKKYLDSEENGQNLKKLMSYVPEEAGIPSDVEWNKIGHSIMGVVQTTTGRNLVITPNPSTRIFFILPLFVPTKNPFI